MSTSQPPPSPNNPPPFPTPPPTAPYTRAISTLSLFTLGAAPILLLLPPRKLDLYTFSLSSAFVVAANHQTRERTGRGILQHVGERRERRRLERERKTAIGTQEGMLDGGGRDKSRDTSGGIVGEEGGVKGMAKKVWYGDEGEKWMEKRSREEEEAEEEGRGVGSVIWGQVREVWGLDKKGGEDGERDGDGEEGRGNREEGEKKE